MVIFTPFFDNQIHIDMYFLFHIELIAIKRSFQAIFKYILNISK